MDVVDWLVEADIELVAWTIDHAVADGTVARTRRSSAHADGPATTRLASNSQPPARRGNAMIVILPREPAAS